MKIKKKNKLPMIILIGIVVLLALGSLNKVSGEAINISTNEFFSPLSGDSRVNGLYCYCLEPGVGLGSNYSVKSAIEINTKTLDYNDKASVKMLKEAYITNYHGSEKVTNVNYNTNGKIITNTGEVDSNINNLSSDNIGSAEGKQHIATYMVKILKTPKQIAVWNVEEKEIIITSYEVNWDMGENGVKNRFQWSAEGKIINNDNSGWNTVFDKLGVTSGAITANKESVNKLVSLANEFVSNCKTHNSSNGLKQDTTLGEANADYTTSNKYVFVGPFKVTGDNLTSITSINVYDYSGKEISSTKYSFVESKTSILTLTKPSIGKTFYIRFNKTEIPNGVKNLKINYTSKYYTAKYYTLGTEGEHQKLLACSKLKEAADELDLNINANVTLVPKLNISLNKINQKSVALTGAKFSIKFEQDGNELTATNNTVQPTSTNPVTVTIKETAAPTGYKLLNGEIVVTFTYDTTNAKWIGTVKTAPELEKSGISVSTTGTGTTTATVTVTDLAKIDKDKFKITKISTTGEIVEGAVFDVSITSGNAYFDTSGKGTMLIGRKSDDKGNITLESIVVTDLTKDVVLKFEEKSTPKGYKLNTTPIILTISYDGLNKWAVKCDGKLQDINGDGKITEEDAELILKYSTGALENNAYGIGKQLVLGDVNNDGGVNADDALLVRKYALGQKSLTSRQLLSSDANGDGKITEEDAELILKYSTGALENNTYGIGKQTGKIFGDLDNDGEVTSADALIILLYIQNKPTATSSGDTIKLTIKNIPMMNLGGKVWLAQFDSNYKTGAQRNKKDDLPAELSDGESRLEKISVKLYNEKGEQITNDAYGNKLQTETENGKYLFQCIPVGKYRVEFEYNGIKLTTVSEMENSVTEINRKSFNDKYRTIKGAEGKNNTGIALDKEGKTITLNYNLSDTTAKLTTTDNITASSKLVDYKDTWKDTWKPTDKNSTHWNSETGTGTPDYTNNALNIDCGLQERIFDLSLGTDVDTATVSVNGKNTTYNYDQILNGDLQNNINRYKYAEDKTNNQISYNLNLFDSDYKYRIKNYGNGISKIKTGNANSLTEEEAEKSTIRDLNELSVDLTYKVVITNQSLLDDLTNGEVKVNGITDYYDSSYTLTEIKYVGITASGTGTDEGTIDIKNLPNINNSITTIGVKEYKKIDLSSGFTNIDLGSTTSPDALKRIEIYLTFKLDTSTNEYRNLGVEPINAGNIAEITSYSTEQGMIDIDSAPDNCIADGILRYEDDTDSAGTLTIQIPENTERKISGTVFDDGSFTLKDDNKLNADGKNNGEQGINDVIVQLIELINVNMTLDGKTYQPYTCEYIWQETRTGSIENARIAYDNSEISIESNGLTDPSAGQYQFTGFIPGNYIVRFIYGDGRKVDVDSNDLYNENVKKYNGQDYKSTVDSNYNKEWYNNAEYKANTNTARDNEARRLEVMSYSTTINNTTGTAINTKSNPMLDATWMCADTSKINVAVDSNDKSSTDSNSSIADGNNVQKNEFTSINFGLALRPKTKLVLEKHITGLKVTPTSGPALLDATANIDDILDDNIIGEKNGVTKGLSTIVSERQNRGFWKLETDLEELAQGANVEVTYTYVAKNEGDEDYLSSTLVGAYKYFLDNNTASDQYLNQTTYNSYLTKISEIVKGKIKTNSNTIGEYLGKYYYSGNDEDKDTLVPTRAEEIEEALNNKLSLDNTKVASMGFEGKEKEKEKVVLGTNKVLPSDSEDNVKINTIIKSKSPTDVLDPSGKDTSKTLTLNTTLSSVSTDSAQLTFDSYIAEITKYTNAAGRADMEIVPANLKYVHSNNTDITLGSKYDSNKDGTDDTPYNERDEFWGETVIISKPTGQDKLTPVQIIAITTAAVAIVGVGTILIKKYVTK